MPAGEIQKYTISDVPTVKYSKPCLLCGEGILYEDSPTTSSVICDDCKRVWKKIKETDGSLITFDFKADVLDNDRLQEQLARIRRVPT